MIHAKEVGMNFRTAMVMIVMAGVTAGGMAGSAHALPRNCNSLLARIDEDNAKAYYWSALAASAADDNAWEEYEFYTAEYTFWVQVAAADLLGANRAHCY
jgi:hypothetical protein